MVKISIFQVSEWLPLNVYSEHLRTVLLSHKLCFFPLWEKGNIPQSNKKICDLLCSCILVNNKLFIYQTKSLETLGYMAIASPGPVAEVCRILGSGCPDADHWWLIMTWKRRQVKGGWPTEPTCLPFQVFDVIFRTTSSNDIWNKQSEKQNHG